MKIRHITMTKHAEIRSQQRGIPPMIVDLLLDFGTRTDQGDICRVVLDKKALKEAKRYGGPECLALLNRYSDVYLVLSEDHNSVVTVAHRHKNLKFKNDNFRRNSTYLTAAA